MEFRILGPLEASSSDVPLKLAAPKQRALLAILLLNANEVVSTDRLIDGLWGEAPPRRAAKAIQVYVSQLRKALDPGVIVSRPPGYVIELEADQLDLHRFERLAAEGRRALKQQDPPTAAAKLREALSLWRGAPLADLAYESFAQVETARLEELRLAALEDRIDADLGLGRHAELIGELEALVSAHALRERLRGQLILALYRCRRQAEALEAYRAARRVLVEELGIEPSRELRELEQAILQHDPSLDLRAAAAAEEVSPPGVFVGRAAELQELDRALADALAGHGRLVLLGGEPGIGKSRLADEVAARARARGARALVGRCWEAGGAPAYWPWVQSLRDYVRNADADVLLQELGSGAAEIAQLLPELRDLFPDLPPPASFDPEASRFRLFDAISALITRSAKGRPLVLVIDDLHAADTPSLLLLRYAANEVADSRVLIVAAYRDTELGADHPLTHTLAELARGRVTRRIDLTGLAPREVAEFIALSGGATPAAELVAAIHDQTEGNPLFIGELVRLLHAEVPLDNPSASTRALATVPKGIREVIAHRLRYLSAECKGVLSVASVFGREFGLEPLRRVSMCGGDELLELLDEAIVARALAEVPGSPGRLRFTHALIRDVLQQELSATRRIQLHRQIGEALEQSAAEPEAHLTELAHHFFEGAPAGDARKAVDYARRAAERAGAQLAYEEAVRLYKRALHASELGRAVDETTRCDLLLGLGDAQLRAGDAPDYKDTFLRAAEIARSAGGATRLAAAALGYGGNFVWGRAGGDPDLIPLLEDALAAIGEEESVLRARLLARLSGALRDQPSRETRTSLATQAVQLARRLDDPATLTWALDGLHMAIWAADTVDERREIATEMLTMADRSGSLGAKLLAHDYRLYAFLELGDLDGVHAERAHALRAAEEVKQPAFWWKVTAVDAMIALFEGRFDEAEALMERALDVGGRVHTYAAVTHAMQTFALQSARGRLEEGAESLPRFAEEHNTYPVLDCALAALHAELGREREARALFERLGAGDFEGLNRDEEWLFAMTLLAPVCRALGDTGRAATLYGLLTPYASRNAVGVPEFATGSVSRSLGLLAVTLERWEHAVRHFEDAVEMNERMGARPWHAHTQHDFACALLGRDARGDRDRARELLARAAETYRELGMDTWAHRAASVEHASRAPARA